MMDRFPSPSPHHDQYWSVKTWELPFFTVNSVLGIIMKVGQDQFWSEPFSWYSRERKPILGLNENRKEDVMDKATLLKTLTETRAAWEALLAQIDEEQMQKPGVAGKWSVKDVIAHVASGEREIVPVLRTHVGSDLWNLSDDERNEIEYQQNKDRPL